MEKRFQSTLPTRGSDALTPDVRNYHRYFNPRSPRGGATRLLLNVDCPRLISIHAPHEGERLVIQGGVMMYSFLFQSTLPTRGSDAYRLAIW